MKLSCVIFACVMPSVLFTTTCHAQLSEVLMLTLSSNSRSDQTAVRFLSDATDTFDSAWDAYKMINPNPTPNIYTVSDQDYAINALNIDFNEKVVALHVRAAYPATYTITAQELGAFEAYWSIHLIDLFLNQDIDLRTITSYSFTANPTDSYHRFSLKFMRSDKTSLLITDNAPPHQKDLDHIIYTNQDKIVVSTGDEVISSSCINDLEGNLIYTPPINAETWTFSPDKTGVYIVHISTHEHNYTKKVMINKY